ncbi:hypothetical protein BGW39_011600, partial [Mortierella sp. 14UC]
QHLTMTSSKQAKPSKYTRTITPSNAQLDSTGAKGFSIFQLKQATRKLLRNPIQPKDRTVFNALAAVQLGPAGIFLPQGYEASSVPVSTESNANIIISRSPLVIQQPNTTFFTQNLAAPTLTITLPPPGARFESTAQLALCYNLLRRHLLASMSTTTTTAPLDPAQQVLVQPFFEDEEGRSHVFELARKVVEEFVADSFKSFASVSEVVLFGPGLDRETHRKLLNSLIAEFEHLRLLDKEVLQGLLQMIECAGQDYLVADDLIRILAVLRTRLQDTHQQSTEHPYYLVLALSRLLDVMVEGKVKDLSRVTQHEPLSALLRQLAENPDMYLKYQATYALQGLLHIPNDETHRESMLRHTGNITMGLLGVASVCKLDLGEIKEGVGQLYKTMVDVQEVATKAVSGILSLHASGQDIMASVKGGVFSGGRQLWYSALREAQEHIRNGRLADFNRLVFEAPCQHEMDFQWGVCQLLGEVAIDPLWDVATHQYALAFLAQLYKDNITRKQGEDIGRCILDILRQVTDLPDLLISTHARSQLQGLHNVGNVERQNLYRDAMADPLHSYLPMARLSDLSSSPLLDRVQAVPEVDRDLHKLRAMRLKESDHALYIPPQAKHISRSADDTLFPLMENALEFLAGPRQVLLLLGDSGAGKSTFNLHLEHTLWQTYKRGDPVPLHINLPAIDNPYLNLIPKRLQQLDFSEAQIQELKQRRQFIVICDGYDEGQLKKNLYTTNQFNQAGQWKVKLVITCRMQYLGPDYRSRFQPNVERYQQHQQQQQADLFQEALIAPFSRDQIKDYVEQYVQCVPQHAIAPDEPKWNADDYMDKLEKINGLMDLVSNPFLLTLALRALPKAVRSEKDIFKIRLTRVILYDIFTEQWLENNKYRLQDSLLSPEAQATFDSLCDADFIQQGINFQKDLAAAIFHHQEGKPMVEYVHLRESRSWKAAFFGQDTQATLLRESIPLARSGNQYRFLHRSLLEYFFSRLISDPVGPDDHPSGNKSEAVDSRNTFVNHPLNQRSIVEEASILHFLLQRVKSNPSFKTLLLDAVEASKQDDRVSLAAANAMSILVKADVRFNGADLAGIRIPGANLRYGLFDCADLRGADLTGTKLCKVWLRKANLSGARMEGVDFEELPYLDIGGGIKRCVFSSDGKLLVVSTYDCRINTYDTSTWTKVIGHVGKSAIAISPCSNERANAVLYNRAIVSEIHTSKTRLVLSGHDDSIDCIAYSPDGNHIATGSKDKTVRVWSSQSETALHILRGHTLAVTGVAFSPLGLQLASCSEDKTIRTWNVETGEMLAVWECAAPVHALAYSPDGQQIASSGDKADVRLWNKDSGEVDLFIPCRPGSIRGVAFSRDGRQVATCSDDGTVGLWDSRNGVGFDTLTGDRYQANCAAFSPTDDLLVAGGIDRKVRLWHVMEAPTETILMEYMDEYTSVDISIDGRTIVVGCEDGVVQLWETSTGKLLATMEGHTRRVCMVAFSPCGKYIASVGWESRLRLWCASTGKSIYVLDNADVGEFAAFAPDGARIVLSHEDHTVRVWDVQSGNEKVVLKGHTNTINGVVYSPSGHQIASWSKDMTVRLWSVQTEECFHVLTLPREVNHLVYSADGRHVITMTNQGSSRWDSESGESFDPLKPIKTAAFWCTFTSDGKHLAIIDDEENRLCIFDLTSDDGAQEVLQSFVGPTRFVTLRKLPDGTMIFASTDNSNALYVWRLEEEDKGDGSFKLKLLWGMSMNELSLEDAILDDIVGLSEVNLRLMKQRAYIDEMSPDWSEGSSEEWFRVWGGFDSDDEFDDDDEDEEESSDVNMDDSDAEESGENMKEPGKEVRDESSE